MRITLIPLGTSAGRPTLQRGASALAVVTEGAWLMCDCGEGAQLTALRAGLSLSRLDAVLITHLHGDHFNGLPGLLGTLGLERRTRPLIVCGPPGLGHVLRTLQEAGSLGTGEMEVRVLEQRGLGSSLQVEEWQIETRALVHRVPTYGYRVALPDRPGSLDVEAAVAAGVPKGPLLGELKAGRSVVVPGGAVVRPEGLVGETQKGAAIAYTLDTVPCQGSVEIGKGVDALVHEATYEDARRELAHERGHSTGVEAARIAADAEAGLLVLTHFSPSVEGPRITDEARAIHPDVVAAEDLRPLPVQRSSARTRK